MRDATRNVREVRPWLAIYWVLRALWWRGVSLRGPLKKLEQQADRMSEREISGTGEA